MPVNVEKTIGTPVTLRSNSWFDPSKTSSFIARSWMRRGLPNDVFDQGKPIIGICTAWSELAPCNLGLKDLAEHVKRGIWESGGVPFEFPMMSLGEAHIRPTSMLYRNLASIEVEESIRANPIDGVVLLGGCDKSTPAQMMGAASAGLPTIVVSAGPMLTGRHRGKPIGSGTDYWRYSQALATGEISLDEFRSIESGMTRSDGVCMTMGTASTMACISEALGMSLPGNGSLPAPDSRRLALAHESGRRIVSLVADGTTMTEIVTSGSLANAVRVVAAIGGSTNAVLHLLALARRLNVAFDLADFDRLGHDVPLLVDIMPSGRFLMEDFAYAGGVSTVLNELDDLIDDLEHTVGGASLRDLHRDAAPPDGEVIRPRSSPVIQNAGLAVLRGNLAPNGCILKVSAASTALMEHTGPAVVFDNVEDLHRRIDDENLDVTPDSVLVLRNCGPAGYPGMPEVGNIPIPQKLLATGVTDMVRISDARMSGTSYGTVLLHCAPESAVGGPLRLVRTGDLIAISVTGRSVTLIVSDEELEQRRADAGPQPEVPSRGWERLYVSHVTQADEGADLDFLAGSSRPTTRYNHGPVVDSDQLELEHSERIEGLGG